MNSTTSPPPPDAPVGEPTPDASTDPSHQGPRRTAAEVRDLTRLRRSVTDRKIAGVAGGIARHLDIDPVIVRVVLVVLVFFGGAGLIMYAGVWLLVPRDGTPDTPFGLDDRNRSIAVLVVGAVAALSLIGDSAGAFWFPWPLAIVALVVVLILNRRDRRRGAAATNASTATATGQSTARISARDPRKRGPLLFWFTLALAAVGVGVLSMIDLAGVDVPASAYPALALGLVGLMLVVGAFYGRAGGLILVGLVLAVTLAGSTAAGRWDSAPRTIVPTSAAAVASAYGGSGQELLLDLTQVRDLDELDGRVIMIDSSLGQIEVIVPDELTTRVEASITGIGRIELFGDEVEGFDVFLTHQHDQGNDERPADGLTIVVQLSIGEIEVHS